MYCEMFLSGYNVLEPILQTALSVLSLIPHFCSHCKTSQCALHCANVAGMSQMMFRVLIRNHLQVSSSCVCVRVPLERKSEQLCSYWKTRRVPVSLHILTLKISQTKYLYISSPV